MEKKRIVLQPEYMKSFKCIGSACEDSCCVGWRVVLDKKTYRSYKDSRNETLKKDFEKRVTRIHNNPTETNYGKIKMLPDGSCPFLNEKDLCNIYIELGESYLSNTCTYYPRIVNKIDGGYERSARISCPEIARKVLLNPNGIVFEQIEEPSDSPIAVGSILDTEGHLFLNKPQRYFWEIRLFSLSLIQNRNYSIGERLILLGIVYKKIENLKKNHELKKLPQMLETMTQLIDAGDLKPELDKVPVNYELQMRMAKEMADEKFIQGVTSKRYLECFTETLKGINFASNQTYDQVMALYIQHDENILKPYLAEKEYILENFLVNTFFVEMMPFGKYKTIWDAYMFMCVIYGMTRLHLIGMAGHHQKLEDDMVVKLNQSLSRVIMHNNQYILKMINLLKDSGFDSLAYMSILVKN